MFSSNFSPAENTKYKCNIYVSFNLYSIIFFITDIILLKALHLTRAVATLLHFSPEEERLLQETLEWKMSWFGTRPNLGFGQTAKAIPPS